MAGGGLPSLTGVLLDAQLSATGVVPQYTKRPGQGGFRVAFIGGSLTPYAAAGVLKLGAPYLVGNSLTRSPVQAAILTVTGGPVVFTGQSLTRTPTASATFTPGAGGAAEDPLTYRYVKPTASGTGDGTSWTNAAGWTGTNAVNLQRGFIYWLAGGTYAARAVNVAPSGTSTITLRKASVAEHGTDTGWSNTFGTAQALMGDLTPFGSYINIEGRYKYGIQANQWWHPINCTALRITNVEFGSLSSLDMSQWPAVPTTGSNCYLGDCWFHDVAAHTGDSPCITLFGNNHIVERCECGPNSGIDFIRPFGSGHIIRDNYIHDCTESGNAHMDIIQIFGDANWPSNNIIFERNLCVNWEGQVCNLTQDGLDGIAGRPLISDLVMRNNVFAYFGQNINIAMPNVSLLNNTFYKCGLIYQPAGGAGQAFNGANLVVKNNMIIGLAGNNADFDNYYNDLMSSPGNPQLFRENNFYARADGSALVNWYTWPGQTPEPGGINGGVVGFINAGTDLSHPSTSLDFRLVSNSAAINHGQTLTGFSTDILGVARPQGAAWDMGAYEFAG